MRALRTFLAEYRAEFGRTPDWLDLFHGMCAVLLGWGICATFGAMLP